MQTVPHIYKPLLATGKYKKIVESEIRLSLPFRKRKLVSDAIGIMLSDISNRNFTIHWLAEHLDTNETTLKQAFREIMKTSIYAYFQKHRMSIAIRMMKEGYTIGGISGRVGYSETGHFSYAFKKMYGIPPSRYAKLLLEEMDIHNYSSQHNFFLFHP